MQLDFTSSDLLGDFPKLLKIFAIFDMDDRKEISFGNSINFDKSTKIYSHKSVDQKSQTSPTDISPVRPQTKASNKLSYIFGHFDINEGILLICQKHNFFSEPMIFRQIWPFKL